MQLLPSKSGLLRAPVAAWNRRSDRKQHKVKLSRRIDCAFTKLKCSLPLCPPPPPPLPSSPSSPLSPSHVEMTSRLAAAAAARMGRSREDPPPSVRCWAVALQAQVHLLNLSSAAAWFGAASLYGASELEREHDRNGVTAPAFKRGKPHKINSNTESDYSLERLLF